MERFRRWFLVVLGAVAWTAIVAASLALYWTFADTFWQLVGLSAWSASVSSLLPAVIIAGLESAVVAVAVRRSRAGVRRIGPALQWVFVPPLVLGLAYIVGYAWFAITDPLAGLSFGLGYVPGVVDNLSRLLIIVMPSLVGFLLSRSAMRERPDSGRTAVEGSALDHVG